MTTSTERDGRSEGALPRFRVLVVMLAGAALLAIGLVMLAQAATFDPDRVTCRGEPLAVGQWCGFPDRGAYSYEEISDNRLVDHRIDQVAGGLAVPAGSVVLIVAIRAARRSRIDLRRS